MKKSVLARYCMVGILSIIAAGVISMISVLNPWSVHMPDLDSAVWISSAIKMKQGGTMYVDIWDHKGPILFVIQYIGLSLTPHSTIGIWILEWMANCITVCLLYKTAKLIGANTVAAFTSAVVCLLFLRELYSWGNCVEMWALPFITGSLVIFIKYFQTEKIVSYEIGILGVCAACSFLLNGNLISIWIASIPVILVSLIYKKQWQELKVCCVSFLIGVGLVVIPVVITLTVQGALLPFIETYFGFNATYAGDVTFMSFYSSVMKFAYYNNYFILAHIGCLLFWIVKEKWKPSIPLYDLWYTGISLAMLSMSGKGFVHYGIQLIPCMIIPVAICFRTGCEWCENNKNFTVAMVLIFLLWGRFEIDPIEEGILWTMDTNQGNYGACGDYEKYEVINNWTGKFTEEELKTKVFVYPK